MSDDLSEGLVQRGHRSILAAIIDNHLYHGKALRIEEGTITWPRVLAVNDRALRHIIIGLGNKTDGVTRQASFDITPASEVMVIMLLAQTLTICVVVWAPLWWRVTLRENLSPQKTSTLPVPVMSTSCAATSRPYRDCLVIQLRRAATWTQSPGKSSTCSEGLGSGSSFYPLPRTASLSCF
ncbi:Formate--tetrahydrofolate ligase [Actinomyces bovis]|uniref:Formate--tetrahydrofolate ligase n=1 Tax=Actinomyces bovis TaxID=1658 RepID=A0ABY1VQE6_9ACTO|nr:Formate--tetrahydrofolate ligase [Actinomyces bovis]VEG53340.1 Formate--tetrahydrofolate ligase [Actinomyces israelii]